MIKQAFYFLLIWPVVIPAWAHAQIYVYNPSGSLIQDANKQITSIHYNHLNLPDTITYADGRKAIYAYLSSGQKIRQQAIDATGKVITHKRYNNGFLYDNDTLREIQHEDGRIVPPAPGANTSLWEYQYHLKDHLSNVRSAITSSPQTSAAVASFEASSGATGFLRYEHACRINAMLFDHTKTGTTHYSQRLNGSVNERYGIARTLSVMPGDTVKLEVFAKYVEPNANNRTSALNTLLAQIASGLTSAGTVVDGANYATSTATFPFTGLDRGLWSVDRGREGTGPKAYLNWLVFNRDFTFCTGGFEQMTTAAREGGMNVAHERLASTLIINEPGYVYVYLSNEEATPLEVYFDDLTVTQVTGPVVQQTDYDPFGLAFNAYNRENSIPNRFLYNGKELQKDFDLNWYDYGARMYDAALGRWHAVDPMAEKYMPWSPYNYALNNPLKFVDPDGRKPIVVAATTADEFNRVMGAIDELREIPGAAEVIRDIEDSEHTVTISLTDKDSKQVVDDKPGALPKGVKHKAEGKVLTGTGKGSSVTEYISVSAQGTTPEELSACVGSYLATANTFVQGNLDPKMIKGPDGNAMYKHIIQAVNVENYVRAYHHLPLLEKSYNGTPLYDKNGYPLYPGVLSKQDIETAIHAKTGGEFRFWPSINRKPPP